MTSVAPIDLVALSLLLLLRHCSIVAIDRCVSVCQLPSTQWPVAVAVPHLTNRVYYPLTSVPFERTRLQFCIPSPAFGSVRL